MKSLVNDTSEMIQNWWEMVQVNQTFEHEFVHKKERIKHPVCDIDFEASLKYSSLEQQIEKCIISALSLFLNSCNRLTEVQKCRSYSFVETIFRLLY